MWLLNLFQVTESISGSVVPLAMFHSLLDESKLGNSCNTRNKEIDKLNATIMICWGPPTSQEACEGFPFCALAELGHQCLTTHHLVNLWHCFLGFVYFLFLIFHHHGRRGKSNFVQWHNWPAAAASATIIRSNPMSPKSVSHEIPRHSTGKI